MHVSDFDFHLPDDLIAQTPSARRGDSRLLVLPRAGGALTHTRFPALGDWLREGDLLVLNNTRVFPARLLGHRVPSGGAVECLLMRPVEDEGDWEALVSPGARLKPGAAVIFERDGVSIEGEILERRPFGRRRVRLRVTTGGTLEAAIDRVGHIPLPPYIKRDDTPEDRERYQTVFAAQRGSIAAPTAGLHFTPELLDSLAARGVQRAEVTLHVGYGTFKPVRVERVEEHAVDPETISVGASAAAALTAALREGRRVIAVGTTTARALESLEITDGEVSAAQRETALFIRPGHQFRVLSGLVTNFHLPCSSLLMLVASFAGVDPTLDAYRAAVTERYRFYSYGDAMLVI